MNVGGDKSTSPSGNTDTYNSCALLCRWLLRLMNDGGTAINNGTGCWTKDISMTDECAEIWSRARHFEEGRFRDVGGALSFSTLCLPMYLVQESGRLS